MNEATRLFTNLHGIAFETGLGRGLDTRIQGRRLRCLSTLCEIGGYGFRDERLGYVYGVQFLEAASLRAADVL